MNPRHEKHKPHLVKQYGEQDKRVKLACMIAYNSLFNQVHAGINKGSFYSERFKK